VLPATPRRIVQVFGVHGTDDDGCQNQRRLSTAPVGVRNDGGSKDNY
jgi:hypothetical protein